ncbi:hypothetical protein EYC55_17910 [Xanthomonas oryzae]|nr:hypothetical protein EYR26_04660 [Xanthomonas oryzae]QBG96900.1 hypothetical protein EYC55_17910 [Xanthomonas oryzae]
MGMSRDTGRLQRVCLFLTFSFFLLVHSFRVLPPTNPLVDLTFALVDLTFVVACVAVAMFFPCCSGPMQLTGFNVRSKDMVSAASCSDGRCWAASLRCWDGH